jgi:hypothetical protein
MSYPLRAAVVLLSLSSLAGCNKAQVRMPVATPALAVPIPETRLVIPAPPVEAPAETPPAPEPAPVAQPPITKPNPPNNRTSQPPAPATPPPATPPPTTTEAPPQVLQPTANVGELQKRATDLLNNAERDLARVNETELSRESRGQLNEARGFVRGSRNAMAIKNYVLAAELAGKAATLAAALVKG